MVLQAGMELKLHVLVHGDVSPVAAIVELFGLIAELIVVMVGLYEDIKGGGLFTPGDAGSKSGGGLAAGRAQCGTISVRSLRGQQGADLWRDKSCGCF
jgi:hypothetical protein